MKRSLAILLTLLALFSAAHAESCRTFFAMDTVMTLRAEEASDDLLADCEAEVLRLEALLSATDPDSEISRLNRTGKAVLSRDTFGLLQFARDMGKRTGGALDVTLYPVVRAWGFTTGQTRVPGEAELELLLQRVDYRQITLHADGTAQLPEGVMVDLGSIAKGYASDAIADRLRQAGVQSALIDLGGNLYCLGTKADGSDWRVGIRSPLGDGHCAALSVQNCAVVTSGNYERSFTAADGTRYGHIFDPGTGCPVEGDLLSATVIGQEGALCDALSTALFVMGSTRATEYLACQSEVEAILLCEDGRILASAGLRETLRPMGEFEAWEIQWIEAE